jgi:molybdate transport system permease protein
MSIAIYEAVHAGDDALANTLVLIASVVCIALLVGASVALRRGQRNVRPL